MKILHLATFIGNIGDNASHIGFHSILPGLIGDYTIDQLEIRKTYGVYTLADKWGFNEDFATKANQYDLLLIGGGHFLDFWLKNSSTGTALDINDDLLDKIKVPILITSTGCMPRNDIPEGNIQKLQHFLDRLLNRNKTFVAVRNDGSKEILREDIGQVYYDNIPEVLDSGFFYDNDGSLYTPFQTPYVVINSTVDQLGMKSKGIGKIDSETYVEEMGKIVNHIINTTDMNIAFAPHIYSDFEAIDVILKQVNDWHIRTRVCVMPYAQGDYGCDQIFSAYKNSSLVVGMRFHTNVCSLSMNKISIGLAATDRMANVYKTLGLSDRIISVDKPFSSDVIEKIPYVLSHKDELLEVSKKQVDLKKAETLKFYENVFNSI